MFAFRNPDLNNRALIAPTKSFKVNNKETTVRTCQDFQKRQQSGHATSNNLIISYNDKADKSKREAYCKNRTPGPSRTLNTEGLPPHKIMIFV